jgi:hypothetical protein
MTGHPIEALLSTRAWAEAIARLPAPGPLPCRTVLVPRERVAHALRRELIRAGHEAALAGTRFITPVAAALAVLEAAGIACEPGEEALRPARTLTVLRNDARLEHFPLALPRDKPGWDDAFAHTIGDLEAAALRHPPLSPHLRRSDTLRLTEDPGDEPSCRGARPRVASRRPGRRSATVEAGTITGLTRAALKCWRAGRPDPSERG